MAALEHLPPDERAVLQLVLTQGRGYDDIGRLLAIDRAAVRQRALSAFDALGPETRVPPERRALITDYLLGQLPPLVADGVRERLGQSASDRAWARAIAAELEPIARHPLPDIPVPSAQRAADVPQAPVPPSGSRARPPEPAPAALEEPPRRGAARRPAAQRLPNLGLSTGGARRTSRPGGALLLAVLGVAVVVVIVLALTSGGGSSGPSSASSTTVPAAATSATGATGATGATPHIVAQFSLAPTVSGSKAQAVVEVLKAGIQTGIAIVASGLAPNAKNQSDYYAVWLYNSPTDFHYVGSVSPGVGASGRLTAAGGLTAGASRYHELIITHETTRPKPTAPGQIVLEGATKGI